MAVYGNADKLVNSGLKAWIKPTENEWFKDMGEVPTVVGIIGPGTSSQLQANWNSPFEQSSVGSAYEKTAGLVQQATGLTSVSTLNGEQIWDGNRPESFNLVLLLYAMSQPEIEVVGALTALQQMISPQVRSLLPGGRMPPTVSLNIGRSRILNNMVIESVSIPYDGPKDSQGRLLRAEVNLTIQTKNMQNASDIARTWGI